MRRLFLYQFAHVRYAEVLCLPVRHLRRIVSFIFWYLLPMIFHNMYLSLQIHTTIAFQYSLHPDSVSFDEFCSCDHPYDDPYHNV